MDFVEPIDGDMGRSVVPLREAGFDFYVEQILLFVSLPLTVVEDG